MKSSDRFMLKVLWHITADVTYQFHASSSYTIHTDNNATRRGGVGVEGWGRVGGGGGFGGWGWGWCGGGWMVEMAGEVYM